MGSAAGVPKGVVEALERLRMDSPYYLALSNIHGKYYVYAQTSVREGGRVKTLAKYVGRITHDGRFLSCGGRTGKAQDRKGAEAVRGNDGKAARPPAPDYSGLAEMRERRRQMDDGTDRKILMALSMNGRIEVPYIERIMGISGVNTYARIKRLERDFGIRYTAVIEPKAIGFDEYIAFVKFNDSVPPRKEVMEAIEKIPNIQFATMTSGSFDIMLYFLVDRRAPENEDTMRRIRREVVGTHNAKWRIVPFCRTYGYIPLRKEFFDEVLKKRVWHKTKENPQPKHDQITNREYAVIRELALDGKTNFKEIDERYGFDEGRAQYTYHQLRARRVILRVTLDMRSMPVKYNSIILGEETNEQAASASDKDFLIHLISDTPGPTNKYSLTGYTYAEGSWMLVSPIFHDGDEDAIKGELERLRGLQLHYLVGTSPVLGSICMRKYDNACLNHNTVLKERFNIDLGQPVIDYEGAKKHERKRVDIRGLAVEEEE